MSDESNVITIESGKNNRLYLRDLWNYRELFAILAWRDIIIRYKQTMIGIAWGVIKPVVTMTVFTIVFGKIANLPSDGVPYVLAVLAGMIPWQFFSGTIGTGGESLIGNQGLISKVYFPRLIIPTSALMVNFVELLISTLIFIPLFFWFRYLPHWTAVFAPLFLIPCAMMTLGITYFCTSVNVRYRDFRYVVPFVLQFGMYISPVGFVSSVVPEKWRFLYMLNPMVGVIDGVRWSLFGTPVNPLSVVISVTAAVLVLLIGFFCFRRMEKDFADYI